MKKKETRLISYSCIITNLFYWNILIICSTDPINARLMDQYYPHIVKLKGKG